MNHRLNQRSLPCLTALAAIALATAPAAFADVQLTGEYSPADDPTTEAYFEDDGEYVGNEGIQEFLEFTGFGIVPPDELPQYTLEEGRGDEYVNIEIGIENYGRMTMDGASILRYGHLIIGGSREDVNFTSDDFSGSSYGIGIVSISGFGTVYNSDPNTIQSNLVNYDDPTPRDEDSGYDVYVGLTGTGTLEVLDGGRVEIGDSMFVGVAEGSSGSVVVSGVGSVITQSGVKELGENEDEAESQAMFIGVLGTGSLEVLEGGIVNAKAGLGVGTTEVIGTSDGHLISGTDYYGGSGSLLIDGSGSRVNASSGVTIGVYYEDAAEYVEGGDLGTSMTISNSGLLNITQTDSGDSADLYVGRFAGTVLDSGRIVVADGFYHDGDMRGTGRLTSKTFNNRQNGEIIVEEGDVLRFTSTGKLEDTIADTAGAYLMANSGLIDVIGGEVIFERSYTDETDMFINRVEPENGALGEGVGRIHGQDATIRFRSGLLNQAVVAFTAGDNILSGDVINEIDGDILISGNANVVFQNDLTNLGDLELAPDGSAVTMTVLGEFTAASSSSISLALGGGTSGYLLSSMAVAGDITLAGELNVDLSANGASPLDPMEGDQYEIISGTSTLNGMFNTLNLPTLSTGLTWGIDLSNADFTLVVVADNSIGGDFNGDGIVDESDFAVWQANFGINSGATGSLGDADGDGDVDGADYLIWLGQVGGAGSAPLGASSSSGYGQFVASVPEPSSALLLAAAGLAACCFRRRTR